MSSATHRLEGLRVLIVEDELLVAMELEALLQGLGCLPLDPVPTVKRALRALEREPPDIAVLDVNVRGEPVTPVAEALQELGIPFLLVSGYGSERLRDGPLQGATHLRKPVEAHRLGRTLLEVLARRDRAR